MIITGYKGFNSDKTNHYGMPFEEGKFYKTKGDIKFGNNGNGFHFCTHLADVFRYFDDDVIVAKVIGFGKNDCYNDEYYGYYDMYASANLYIEKFLTREEIINIMLESSHDDIKKFLITFKLNLEEKKLFWKQFYDHKDLINTILYYQDGDKDIFNSLSLKKKKG